MYLLQKLVLGFKNYFSPPFPHSFIECYMAIQFRSPYVWSGLNIMDSETIFELNNDDANLNVFNC